MSQAEIVHEGSLGQLSSIWRQWSYVLGPDAWKLYKALRDERFDGALVDLKIFALRLGLSYSALLKALRVLEENNCITMEEDDS